MKEAGSKARFLGQRNRKWVWLSLLVVVFILFTVFRLLRAEEVDLVRVVRGDIKEEVVETGYVEAAEKEEIYCAQAGLVKELLVERGQPVNKGQVLAVLENPDISAQKAESLSLLKQTDASLRLAVAAKESALLELEAAEKEWNRLGQLYEIGAVSEQEWEKGQAEVGIRQKILAQREADVAAVLARREGALKLLKEAEAKEGQLVIRSPLEGEVIFLGITKNQVVNPQTLAAEIGKVRSLKVTADVALEEVGKIQVGQRAWVSLGEKKVAKGEVIEIYPKAEERQSALGLIQRKVPVVIRLDQARGLKPGYEVKVSIITRSKQGTLLLPKTAVTTGRDGDLQVMRVVGGRIRFQKVVTGLGDDDRIEIVKGLGEGDLVVRDGSLVFKEGQRIRAIRRSEG